MSQFIEMFGDTHMRSDHSRQWKEVVEIINGKDYKSIQVEDGGYPVYGTGGEMARASDYLSPANSILLGRKGTIDKPLLIREKYWNVDTAFGAVPDEKVLHYVYFYWHCKTIDFNVLNKGTTLPSTTKVDLLNLWIKIPSMEEQTRFGSIVEQADKSEFVGCKSQFIEMYYNTHNKQTLESVCPIMNKGITPKYVESSSVLVINQACIHWDGQRLGNIKYHNEEIPVRKRILESGDVLLNATGNGTLGRCCVFICPSDNNTYINDGHVIALSTDRAVILPEVLNTYLSLNDTQAEIYRQYVTGSTNQVDIVFSDIKKMKVPVPSMDEQILFVEVLTQADKSEFVGCKSQFIEMFGDTHMRSDHSRQWKEVVEIINGKDYKSIQVEDGGYPVYGTGGEMARASDYLSPANSILLGRKGTIDKPLLIREKYWNVDTAFGAVPDEKVLHYVYFYWHCKTIDFNVLNKGTTLPSTTKVDLLNLWIKIPSMEEQTRFGSIVEQADKSEFVGCKSQFIEMYYNTHNKQTLESVCPIMNKGITPKYVESSSVLVINQACIHWDGQRLGNIKYHNEEIPVRKRILESGDVLLNATGNGTLGRCCVFICPSDNNTYINDGHVIALSTDRAVILPEVLNTYLSLNDTQAEIYRQYVTGSTNQVDIVFSDIKKMKVPVPSMDEQILFVEVLTQADKSEYYN